MNLHHGAPALSVAGTRATTNPSNGRLLLHPGAGAPAGGGFCGPVPQAFAQATRQTLFTP